MNSLVPVKDQFQCVIMPMMFRQERTIEQCNCGITIDDVLTRNELQNHTTSVALNGLPIDKSFYKYLYPKKETSLTIRVVPQGGDGKNPLASLLTIAVGFASFGVGSWAVSAGFSKIAAGLIQGAAGLAGRLLVSAIAPPPTQKLSNLTGEGGNASATYSITGVRNAINLFGAVPRIYGTHRIYPPLGAPQYTEVEGDDQYLNAMFVVGYGELDISDLRIGETPINNFEDVETNIRYGAPSDGGFEVFTNSIIEEPLSVDITADGPDTGAGAKSYGPGSWSQRRTEPDTRRFIVDIAFPSGLGTFVEKVTKNTSRGITVNIQYRNVDGGSWVSATSINIASSEIGKYLRLSRRLDVTTGQYDVRVRVESSRTGARNNPVRVIDTTVWTSLKSVQAFKPVDPVILSNIATVELRIKASAQLNNLIDQFNCIAKSKLSNYNGSTWPDALTQNPASVFRDVLQGSANPKPLADAEIDIAALEIWHDECESQGWKFNGVIDTQTTLWQMLRDVAATGRASPAMIDGKFTVVQDKPNSTIVQHFTPRNSFAFSGSKAFNDLPHALKIRFVNEDESYQQDERIVYDDGYTESTATEFEVLEMPYITDPDLIWRHGRFFIAQGRLRPEFYEFTADVEHIVCTRGDLIRFTHDVPLFGLHVGRIKSVTVDGGGDVTHITVDEDITMESGKSYGVRIRLIDGTSVLNDVVLNVGTVNELEMSPAIPVANAPAEDDLVLFGESGTESIELIVTEIRPAADLTARIVCQDAAPAIHNADTDTIPAFDSQITIPPAANKPRPPKPLIISVASGEDQLIRSGSGAIQSRIVITLQPATSADVNASKLKVEKRLSQSQSDGDLDEPLNYSLVGIFDGNETTVSIIDVEDTFTYDLRLYYVSEDSAFPGLTSEYALIDSHTVIGKSTPPDDITTFLRQGNNLIWSYTPPVDHAGFQIRYNFGTSRSWTSATKAHPQDDLISGNIFPIADAGMGQITYLIKPVDVAGNEAINASALTINLGDVVVDNLQLTKDEKAEGFTGTITNGSVSGANLVADNDNTLLWAADDSKKLWEDDSQLLWGGGYLEMVYEFEFAPYVDSVPDGILKLEHSITASEYKIEYKVDGANTPLWSGDGNTLWNSDDSVSLWTDNSDEYLPWTGELTPVSRVKYLFRITVAAGNVQGQITDLKIHVDVPDIIENIDDFVVGASGTITLPITKTYRAIKNIQYTLQDDGNGADNVVTINKTATAPTVETRQGSTRVQGLIDATIQGY